MVAAISGQGLGLFNTSATNLNGQGTEGTAAQGRTGEQIYVNTANGNLVVQDDDELLTAEGLSVAIVRTYNSQGTFSGGLGENWRLGVNESVSGLTGTVNTAGSTITKTFGDGAAVTYTYDATQGVYTSSAGSGADDALSYNSTSQQWSWTDGASRTVELYDNSGSLLKTTDSSGNSVTYSYSGSLLTQIADASGQVTTFTYSGGNISQITTQSNGVTQTQVYYSYDSLGRLSRMTVDLSPQDGSTTDGNLYSTTYAYQGNTDLIASITQSDGSSISFTYQQVNGQNWVHTYTDGLGNTTTLTYNTSGASAVTTSANSNALHSSQTTSGGGTATLNGSATGATQTQLQQVIADLNSSHLSTTQTSTQGGAATLSESGLGTTETQTKSNTASLNSAGLATTQIQTQSNTATLDGAGVVTSRTQSQNSTATLDTSELTNSETQTQSDSAYEYTAGLDGEQLSTTGFQATIDTATVNVAGVTVTQTENESAPLITSSLTIGDPPSYVVQSGDTWAWIAGELYGARALANQLETALGNPTLTPGSTLTGLPDSLSYTVTTTSVVPPTYTVKAGDTWASIAKAIYGSSEPDAATELAAALGSPTLTAGEQLTMPSSLIVLATAGSTLLPWYAVHAGDTWASVTQAVYGTSAPEAVAALQTLLGDPALTAGQTLYGLPQTLQVTDTATTQVTGYTVQSGDTWTSLAQRFYGTNDPLAAAGLQAALGGAALAAGEALTSLPSSFTYSLSAAVATPESYVIQSGDTWETIATKLYGDADASVALADAYQVSSLVAGQTLNNLPTSLYYPVGDSAVLESYVVQPGDTWASITQALYESSDPAAAAVLEAVAGDPALAAGEVLTIPPSLTVTGSSGTTTINIMLSNAPDYTVQAGDTWASITQTLFGTSNAGAIQTMQALTDDPDLTPGTVLTGLQASLGYTVLDAVPVQPYYTVRAGDTWASIAQTMYGTSAVASELQATLGNPALTAGTLLVGLPGSISYTSTTNITVAPYYTVNAGDTWDSIAQKLYGVDAGAQLEAALGSPTLFAGEELNNLPAGLLTAAASATAQAPTYTVRPGDTWSSIAQTLYGTNQAAGALQSALDFPDLTVGTQLTDLPTDLDYSTPALVAAQPYYAVQAGDTWASITQTLYGMDDPNAVAALQAWFNEPSPSQGETLYPPPVLAYQTSASATALSYTVQGGDTWASVTQALYGTSDPNASAALQTALGNPTLTAGAVLTDIPAAVTYETNASPAPRPSYIVQDGDTWGSIALALYGVSDPGAVSALQTALGNPALTPGATLTNLPSSLTYAVGTPVMPQTSYVVQAGDTWSGLAQKLYGSTNPDAGGALQEYFNGPGDPAPGTELQLPTQVPYTAVSLGQPQSYVVQAGDTWQSITNAFYGTIDPPAITALQALTGVSTLTDGEVLTNLPAALSYPMEADLSDFQSTDLYTVQFGDSWNHIAAFVYFTDVTRSDSIAQLQAAAGNPPLIEGEQITLPETFDYTMTRGEQMPPYVVQAGDTFASITESLFRTDNPNAIAQVQQQFGPTLFAGKFIRFPPTYIVYQDTLTLLPASSYTVASGDNWSSVTQSLYGTDDPNAIAALQTALGNPTLTPGEQLTGFPPTLNYTRTQFVPLSPDYTVQEGDSWQSIASTVYGDSAAADALQAALGGDDAPTPGQQLTDLPAVLSYYRDQDASLQPYYIVQAGDTWASITQDLYGTSDPNAVAQLQSTMGNVPLVVGQQLTLLPQTLYFNLSGPVTLPSTYTVQDGDTWESIAATLYGSSDLADALEDALGDPTLTAGEALSGLPPVLSSSSDGSAYLQPYYTVKAGDTWTSIAQALYGSTDPNVIAALQLDLESPTLSAGERLSGIPATLYYGTTATGTTSTYTVLAGDTWASVTKAVYGTSDPNAVTALQAFLNAVDLVPGEQLANLPHTLNYSSYVVGVLPSDYTVQVGDTWSTIAQTLYGNSALADELEDALGDPTLTPGEQLTDLPESLSNAPDPFNALQPFYVVQEGDTWATIADALYGTSDPNVAAALEAAAGSPDLTPGELLTGLPESLSYVTNTTVTLPPAYIVQDGDTWASIAQELYGTSDVADALQAALGDPPLEDVTELTGLPPTLNYPTTVTVTVPPYYTVVAGDTWASIAQALYGSSQAASALQSLLGNPPLNPGEQLNNLPATLSYLAATSTVAQPYYTVQAGDTWASIAQTLYGTTAVANELQSALGNPSLTAGTQLTNLPLTLSYTVTANALSTQSYTVQTGDTWASITQTLYGTSNAGAATALQEALGNPTLITGALLVGIPSTLPYQLTTSATAQTQSPYTIQVGDTWVSVTEAIYGTSDPNAAAALQAALGNPSLTAGQQLANFPGSLSYTTTATAVPHPYYTVQAGDTWTTITLMTYGTADGNAAAALQALLGNPPLTAGERLTDLPLTLAYTRPYTIIVPPYYAVQSGDTWSSIATTLYGTDAVASQLQSAMGNAVLTPGAQLTGFPSSLGYSTTSTVTVAPYYTVQAGDTWSSIAVALYGTSAVASQLQSALGNPALTAGTQLTGLPDSFTYSGSTTATVTAYYTVQVGDTWSSIAQTLYGTSQVAGALQAALGGVTLLPGEQLTNLPSSLSYTTSATTTAPTYYIVQAGDSWTSIAQTLYGTGAAASALQTALGNPVLAPGEKLTGLPSSLSYTTSTTATTTAYYTVQAGDTWSSIALAVYGTSDANAVAALQTAMGNPALTAGTNLSVPSSLTYTPVSSTVSTQTEITDPLGLTTTLTNDTSGRLVGMQSPSVNGAPLATQFAYGTDGKVSQVTQYVDGVAQSTVYQYDAQGNLLLTRDADGDTVTRTYDAGDQVLTETTYSVADPNGANPLQGGMTTWYVYDSDERPRFEISPTGDVTEYQYDAQGNRSATLVFTNTAYDTSGLTTTDCPTLSQMTTWASGQDLTQLERTDFTYDFRGNLSSSTSYAATDATGAGILGGASVTQYVYDQNGRLLQTIDPRGEGNSDPTAYTTSYTYDGLGRVLSETQWVSSGVTETTLYHYDDAHNTITTTLANGLVTTAVYNADDELASSTSSTTGGQQLGVTTYTYDADGRLRTVKNPDGIQSHILYDSAGRKAATVDGNGTLTQYIYNAASQVVETIEYAGTVNVSALADVSGAPANVSLATLISQANTNPSQNQITRAVYDAAGRQIYSIDAAGAVTENVYDGAGRVTDVIAYATPVSIPAATGELQPAAVPVVASASDRHTRSFYDDNGNLIGTLDPDGYLTTYSYDDAGELVQQTAFATVTTASLRASGTLVQLIPASDSAHDQVSEFFYDGQGRRVGEIDADGYLTTTQYDAAGNVTEIIQYPDPVTFTTGATLSSLTPAGTTGAQITRYQYDGLNQLVQEINYQGTVTQYQYDSVGNLISTTVAAGTADARTTQTRYDAQGRVVALLTAQGSAQLTSGMTQAQINAVWAQYSVQYTYDSAGLLTSTTDEDGHTTYYYYDNDGQLRYQVDPAGDVTETRYDALGRVTDQIKYDTRISTTALAGGLVASTNIASLVQAVANTSIDSDTKTTYGFTAAGRTQTATTSEGESTTEQDDAFGEATSITQLIGASQSLETDYSYDRRGSLIKTVSDPKGADTTESSQYDAFGRLIQSTDANGNSETFSYDRLGRQIQTVNALGAVSTKTYDAFARMLSTTDALGHVTTYAYDDATRTMTVTSAEGVAVATTDNEFGQTATVTDGNGNTTTYHYDANGNLTSTADALGTEASQTYDAAGLLLTSTDANGTVTSYTYDAANRVLTKTVDSSGLALLTKYTYDAEGRTLTTTDANGVVTATQYDRDGRVSSVTVDPTGLDLVTLYSYDQRGDVLQVTEGAGTAAARVTQYVYDTLGRRTAQIVDPGSGHLNLTTSYAYDGDGDLIAKTDANGNVTRYVYDADNELRFTIDALGDVTGTSYDADGNLTETIRYANAINLTSLPSTGPISVAQAAALLIPNSSDRTQQSVYDGDGRLVYTIDAAGGVTQNEYDGDDNVVRQIAYAQPVAVAIYSTVQSVQTALAATHDDPSADREQLTVYDARNRAVFSVDALGDVTQNAYDANGNVVQVTHYAVASSFHDITSLATLQSWVAANANPAADQTTRTWYDAAGRAALAVNAGGDVTQNQYDHLGNVTKTTNYATPATIAQGATLAQALAAITAQPTQDQSTQYVYDNAGRKTKTIDATGHTEQYTYDAVGNETSFTNQLGAKWTYEYDANGRMIYEHDPSVAVTTVSGGGSSLTASTTTESLTTYNQYDALGNLISTTAAYGTSQARTTTYVYDALGRQIRTNYPPMSVYNASADNPALVGSAVVRTETVVNPYSEVTYDALGDAVVDRDVSGNYSYRSYDALGRVTFEVDGDNYVTQHLYDTFGNQTDLIRYAAAINVASPGRALSSNQIQSLLTPEATADRDIHTVYDQLNRAITIIQPSAFNFEPAAGLSGGQTFTAGATTVNTYNALGQLVVEAQLVNPLTSSYASTYYYYDLQGLKTAQVDALGNVTTYQYDGFGNVTSQTEYAKPLAAGTWNQSGYATPTATTPQSSPNDPAGYDRTTQFTYDLLNRKLTQTLVDLQYSEMSGSSPVTVSGNQTTSYTYDALGNQTSTTDATGATSYVYYDALGHEIAAAAPSSNTGNGTVTPLTLMKRDAFGNLVEQVSAANSATSVSATSFSPGSASANDRTTLYLTDAYGNVLQTQDPDGNSSFASYYVTGKVAKEWQPTTDDNGATQSLVTIYQYDALGNETETIEPQSLPSSSSPSTPSLIVQTVMTYDAFGEMTAQSVNGGNQVYYKYDQAGRLWNTNNSGGVATVYLYDLAGKATAEIKSQQLDLSTYTSPQSVAALTADVERTETRYDLLGNVVEQRLPSFTQSDPNSGLQEIGAQFQIGNNVLGPSNPDAVYAFNAGFSSDYFSVPASSYLDPSLLPSQGGGYYYTPANGTNTGGWAQDPTYHLVASRYMYWAQPQSSFSGALSYLGLVDGGLSVVATFEYRPAGSSGAYETLPVVNLPNGQFGVDTASLADGAYEYRVTYSRPDDLTPYAVATGTMTFNGSTATTVDTTTATLEASGQTPTSITESEAINSQFQNADFQIGDVEHRGIDQYVYQKVVTGALVDYEVNASATVADGGGYFLTASGYVQDTNYTPATSRYVYWNAPSDSNLTATFEYRLANDPNASWTPLPVVSLPGGLLGAAIGNVPAGNYVYQVIYSGDGVSGDTATGSFDVQPTTIVSNIALNPDPADDAGTVAPLSDVPPNAISYSIVSSAAAGDNGSNETTAENDVLVKFPPVQGPVAVELQYISANYAEGPDGQFYPTDETEDQVVATGGPSSFIAGQPETITLYFQDASQAEQGLNLLWENPFTDAYGMSAVDGISQVTAVRVYSRFNDAAVPSGTEQPALLYATDGNPSTSTLYWKAPTSPGVTAYFQARPVGTDYWTSLPIVLQNGEYTVDTASLPQGAYQYQVTYIQNGYETAQASGTFSIGGNPTSTPVGTLQSTLQTVLQPIQAASTNPLSYQIVSSAQPEYTGATQYVDGYDAQPGLSWAGTNMLNVSWPSISDQPVKIVVSYTSANHATFSDTAPTSGGQPDRWQATGTDGADEKTQTFEFDDGYSSTDGGSSLTSNGASLAWQDADNLPGGLSGVNGISVYTQNSAGDWVLTYQNNSGAPLPSGPGLVLPTYNPPAGSIIDSSDVRISPQGANQWTDIGGDGGFASLAGFAPGNYDYNVTYYLYNNVSGAEVPYAQVTGVVTIPTDATTPVTLTQASIVFDQGAENDFPVQANGTTLSWSQPPENASDTVTVLTRPVGSTTWTPQTFTFAPATGYSVDIGPGPVEYEIQYVSATTGLLYAATSGTFDESAPAATEPPSGGIGPISGTDNPNVTATIITSAISPSDGDPPIPYPPSANWGEGTNEVDMTWNDLGNGPVRVVLGYVSATFGTDYHYENFVTGQFGNTDAGAWIDEGELPGVETEQTFEFDSASTGAALTWTDSPQDGQVGGITQVLQAQVYTQDANGNWVLAYDWDGNAPVASSAATTTAATDGSTANSRTLYWPSPQNVGFPEDDDANPSLQEVFQIRAAGTDVWQTLSVAADSQLSSVDLDAFAAGDYDYRLSYVNAGVTTDVATGVVTIKDTAVGGTIQVTQSTLHFTVPSQVGDISANGTQLSWNYGGTPDTTVSVEYRAQGSSTWLTETLDGQGPSAYTADLSPAGSGPVEFRILYTSNGSPTPYAETDGVLNPTVSTLQTSTPDIQITQSDNFTSLLPIDGLTTLDGIVSWSTPLPLGETVQFRYQLPDGSWQTATPVADGAGYAVDLSSLPPGTYAYQIDYLITGQAAPAYYASGVLDLTRQVSGGDVSLIDTTQFFETTTLELDPQVPDLTQTVDRWGDVLSSKDARGETTNYRYNQLGQVVDTLQPQMQVTSTAGGTVTTSQQRPETQNDYDILGRLIATRDADGNVNTVTYNAAGEILSQNNADGSVKRFVYDAFGDQINSTDALGYQTRNTYDRDGRLVEVQQETMINAFAAGLAADISTQTYTYDQAGRRIAQTDGAGDETKYFYDLRGDVVLTIDPIGATTTDTYDAEGHKSRETDADGNTSTWNVNYFGQLVSSTDLSGAITYYTFDHAGDLLRQASSLGQNLTYTYDEAGHLIEEDDVGTPTSAGTGLQASDRITQYGYDKAGEQVLDRVTVNGLVEQDTTVTYDDEGRILTAQDPAYQLTYSYDAAGNRTNISGTYFSHDGYDTSTQTQDLWYTYDAMNRVLISQGSDIGGTVQVTVNQGVQLTYNADGERASARQYGAVGYGQSTGFSTEVYSYDGLGDLLSTTKDGDLTDSRQYDNAQRETQDISHTYDSKTAQVDQQVQTTTYDADGRTQTQTTVLNNQTQSVVTYGEATYTPPTTVTYFNPFFGRDGGDFGDRPALITQTTGGTWSQGYDAAGVLRGYTVQVYSNGQYQYTDTYTVSYREGSTYEQTGETAVASTTRSGVTLPDNGSTSRTYDVDGILTSTTDSQTPKDDRYFASDSSGNVLSAVQGNFDGKKGDLTVQQAFEQALTRTTGNSVLAQYFFFANGQNLGSFGQLSDPSGFTANFDVNFTPVSPSYPPSVPSSVVAQSGDTLRTIAARVFGDATLWYLIAQENGLTDPDAQIPVGTDLRIPNQVVSLHNNAQSFKPFDVSDALGNTSPTQPAPPPPHHSSGGCGIIGEILVVIVAVVVTIYTAGAASEAIAGALSSTIGSTAAGVVGGVVGGAVGAAAGSIASQGVGIAIGQQSSFNWDQVAGAAVGGAITGGLAAVGSLGTVGQALVGSAATQGADIALGLQKSFNWEEVAAAAVAAPLAAEASSSVQSDVSNGLDNQFAGQIAGNLTSSAINQATVAAFTGGKFNYVQVIADGFGNTIGNDLLAQSKLKPLADVVQSYVQQGSAQQGDANGYTAAGSSTNEQDAPLTRNVSLSTVEPQLQDVTFDANSVPTPSVNYAVQPGDTISGILGTSNPAAVGQFMRENNLTSSTLYPGQSYQMPSGDIQDGDAALGQATLNSDNTRLAQIAAANAAAEETVTQAWQAGVAQASGSGVSPSLSAAFDQQLFQGPATAAPAAMSTPEQQGGFFAGVGHALFQTVYQPLATTYDLEQVAYQSIRSAVTGEAPENIDYTSALGQAAAGGASTGQLLYGMGKAAVLAPFNVGYGIGTALYNGDSYGLGESLTDAAILFGGAKLGGADNIGVRSPLTVGDCVPSNFGQSGSTSFRLQNPFVSLGDEAGEADSVGGSGGPPPPSMQGPAVFRAPPNATPEEIAQVEEYVRLSNEALDAGALSPTGRVSTQGDLRADASAAARAERQSAAADGDPYEGNAGHVPDTTWTGNPQPYTWLDLSPSVNSSLGAQSLRYPIGFKPTKFVFDKGGG